MLQRRSTPWKPGERTADRGIVDAELARHRDGGQRVEHIVRAGKIDVTASGTALPDG